VIALAVLLLSIPPSGEVHLSPHSEVPAPPAVEAGDPPRPAGGPEDSVPAAVVAGGAVLIAGLTLTRRRHASGVPGAVEGTGPIPAEVSPASGLALQPPDDALVVFVPGHGNGPEVFDELAEHMGLRDDQRITFDYRLATEDLDVVDGSMRASVGEAADALNGFIAGLAELGRPLYIVGFSKGGVTTAELLGRWDDGAYGRPEAVAGVALLDPPMAAGVHGAIQTVGHFLSRSVDWVSRNVFQAPVVLPLAPVVLPLVAVVRAPLRWLGGLVDRIPDDGGYDPVTCSFAFFGCDDERRFLGRASGLDPVVIVSSSTSVTNFIDRPDGLRVNAAVPPPSSPEAGGDAVIGSPGRIGEAHAAVVTDEGVAECLVAEMHQTGTCTLPPLSAAAAAARRPPANVWGELVRRTRERLGRAA